MANKNKNLIIAYFPSREKAEQAAEDLKHWDKQHLNLKLGGMGIMTAGEDGKLKTHKVGARAEGTGAKWGLIVGAATGILSGGITLIGGAIAGLAAGTVAGALFHKRIGMTDEDKDRLVNHLKDGGAALAVMADDDEVEPTKFQLSSQGGQVQSYNVPDPEMEELEEAADVEGVEELDEVTVMDDDSPVEEIATVAATAAVVEAVDEDAGIDEIAVADIEESAEVLVNEEGEIVAAETTAVAEAEAIDKDGHVVAAAAAAATVAVTSAEDDEENEVIEKDVAVDTVSVNEDGEVIAAGTAAAVVVAEGDEVDEAASLTAVLHFKRYNDDYDGWGIHVWHGCKQETSWEKPLPPKGKDDFGLVFEVPLHPDAEGLAYIIHRWDEKDQWDDQYLDFTEHGREVWIVQNMPGYAEQP